MPVDLAGPEAASAVRVQAAASALARRRPSEGLGLLSYLFHAVEGGLPQALSRQPRRAPISSLRVSLWPRCAQISALQSNTCANNSPSCSLGGVTTIALYTVYLYFAYFQDIQFTRFPTDVAKSLRRALYYTNIKPDPKLAHKYYKRAIEQCNDHGLDPFSDDVLGIRIQVAAWLEKIGNFDGAVTVLDGIAKDCLRWVETMEKAMAEGTLPKDGKVKVPKPEVSEEKPAAEAEKAEEEEQYLPENLWGKRTRLLAKTVATNVKLGELCADEHVLRPEESQFRLTWAVETALKELKRRHDEGVKEDEGPWMSATEIGGTLEGMMAPHLILRPTSECSY